MELPMYPQVPLKHYKGTCLFGECEMEGIETMNVWNDDTWVLSFPRSGTTLTQEIVYLLKTGLDFDSARRVPTDERFPFLDFYHPELPLFRGLAFIQEQQPRPRLIKSHLHYHVLPPALFSSPCKKIYVMRNPKDVSVSCMMLSRFLQQLPTEMTTDMYLQEWLDGKTYASPWWMHVRDFWLHRDDPTLLVLRYENIVKDIRSAIRQIAAHLEIRVSRDQVEKIAQHCQFDKMKANDATNATWQGQCRKVDDKFGGHIRKGKIGGWRDYMSETMSHAIDDMVNDKLADLHIDFDYGSEPQTTANHTA